MTFQKGILNPMFGRKGPLHPRWKGGITRRRGRVYIPKPEHPRAHSDGRVRRAILVWEEAHGHPLPKGMDVHHVNGIPDDDRPENLLAITKSKHMKLHWLKRRMRDK